MARTRTLAQLRTDALRKADFQNVDTYVDIGLTGEVTDYVNESIAALWDILIASGGHEWYISSDDVTTDIDSPVIGLPTDFYILKGIDLVEGDVIRSLTPFMWGERDKYTRGLVVAEGGRPAQYRVGGVVSGATGVYTPVVTILPTPQSAYTLRVWYIPHAPVLNADTDVWDGFNGWEEYVTTDVALKLLEKEQNPISEALAVRKAGIEERIRGLSMEHDRGGSESILVTDDFLEDLEHLR